MDKERIKSVDTSSQQKNIQTVSELAVMKDPDLYGTEPAG